MWVEAQGHGRAGGDQTVQYGIMWKTVSEDCNLACDYCYYSRVLGRPQGIRIPPPPILEKTLRDYLATSGPVASIAWQGGEPLLAGLPFFQRVVALEAEVARPRTTISNAVQTNGVLINQAWAQFFREYRFLVGVSLDGPQAVHDAHRVDAGGHGTFNRVMRGIRWLEQERVDFNILTVIGPHNVGRGGELMAFYREHGFRWIQFIPQMAFQSQTVEDPGIFAISPQAYGDFLCEVFDVWYRDGHPDTSIRFFDNVVQSYVGLQPDLCTMRKRCPAHLIVESNGDLYPCDFYIGDEWRIGNIADMALIDAFSTDVYQRFADMKPDLPGTCQRCQWLAHCRGGCPRNRQWDNQPEHTADYFCASFQQFFAYANERLERLAVPLRRARTRSVLQRL